MIVTPGPLEPPFDRLLAALAKRGESVLEGTDALPPGDSPVTLAVGTGAFVFDFAGLVRALGARPFRVLVLSRLGAHPDARAAALQRLWRLEEHVRRGGAPTLTLRFAPLLGRDSPLWRKLASRPSLPRRGRQLLNPVLESDALETLVRAVAEARVWSDWFEVAGPAVWSLAEIADIAQRSGVTHGGAWEPGLDEMAEHRLAEAGPWMERFAITPGSIDTLIGAVA
ncbi:MAG: hypothetical protein ABIU54_03485 [Candidatus Eisenbacteria bacterium]